MHARNEVFGSVDGNFAAGNFFLFKPTEMTMMVVMKLSHPSLWQHEHNRC
jgi:hypothetical protein